MSGILKKALVSVSWKTKPVEMSQIEPGLRDLIPDPRVDPLLGKMPQRFKTAVRSTDIR